MRPGLVWFSKGKQEELTDLGERRTRKAANMANYDWKVTHERIKVKKKKQRRFCPFTLRLVYKTLEYLRREKHCVPTPEVAHRQGGQQLPFSTKQKVSTVKNLPVVLVEGT